MSSSRFLFKKLTLCRNAVHTLFPLYRTIYSNLRKKTLFCILSNIIWKRNIFGIYLEVRIDRIIISIHLNIPYPFIYFIYLSVYLFIYFSLALIQPFVFHFYLTYLLFPLPSLTICFTLFIIYPFCYLIMFLTCSPLCYNIIY